MRWGDVRYCFAMAILVIILILFLFLLSFFGTFFISMATAAKFVLPIAIFLAYLIQLDVDVTGNIIAKLCEVGSEFNIFAAWLPWSESVGPTLRSCHGNKKGGI
jgi:hypothetical protein